MEVIVNTNQEPILHSTRVLSLAHTVSFEMGILKPLNTVHQGLSASYV